MKPEVVGLVSFRPAAETDHSFIFATWLRGLYYGNAFFRQIDKEEFFPVYSRTIQNLIFKPTAEIKIACLKDEPDTILGYSLYEELPPLSILHWVFVKPEWRKVGIAQALMPKEVNTITHIVDSICQLKRKEKAKSDRYLSNYEVKLKNRKLSFKPFMI